MSYVAYSPEWAAAFMDEINSSDHYKKVAANWEGSIGLVVLAEPDKSFPNDTGVFMDLWHGAARDVHICPAEEAKACKFVLTASYSRWKRVAKKELDPVKGIMTGQLKLRGDLPTIVRYVKAAQELVECTTRVDVAWQDEAPVGA